MKTIGALVNPCEHLLIMMGPHHDAHGRLGGWEVKVHKGAHHWFTPPSAVMTGNLSCLTQVLASTGNIEDGKSSCAREHATGSHHPLQ